MKNKTYYDPKTKNHDIHSQNANKTNRLIHEKSPYLLQHANNPVDWYPWGAEAFQKAQHENRPVFLSVGCS
jgi:uncharacterized protein YyaL (SSP411 family)